MAVQIKYADRPCFTRLDEISIVEVKEWYMVLHCSLHISSKCQDMRDSHLIRIGGIYAAAFEAPCTLDHPNVFAQRSAVQCNVKFLRPKYDQPSQTIPILPPIPTVPALNQS